RDVAEFGTVTASWAQPTWEKAQAYAKSAYETVAASQAEITSVLEQQFSEFNKTIVVALDNALKSAPAGSEAFVAGFKSAFQSANAVYESVLKATKQAGVNAEANLAVLTPAAKKKAA
ncbi:MAG: granule-associated-like protein, partial [Proteobacteria bacterium]